MMCDYDAALQPLTHLSVIQCRARGPQKRRMHPVQQLRDKVQTRVQLVYRGCGHNGVGVVTEIGAAVGAGGGLGGCQEDRRAGGHHAGSKEVRGLRGRSRQECAP